MLAPVAAGAMVLAGMTVVGAPGASAATASPPKVYVPDNSGTCGGIFPTDGFWTGPGKTGTLYDGNNSITAAVNDTITIVNECTTDIYIEPGATPPSRITIAGGQEEPVTILGTANLIAYVAADDSQAAATNISGTSPTPPSPPQPSGSSEGSSAPIPVIQQFGLPASGKCEDGATEAMNLAGVGNGGWGISWAQWANERLGGSVCTRTLMYDTNLAKWIVN
jgi:hypothetical protein